MVGPLALLPLEHAEPVPHCSPDAADQRLNFGLEPDRQHLCPYGGAAYRGCGRR